MSIDFENVKVIFPNGEEKKYPKPFILSELLNHSSLSSKDIVALMVNGEVKSLNTIISFGIAKISPVLRTSYEGWSLYRRTLVKIFATAVNHLYSKEFNVIVHHGVNNGYLIKKKMKKILLKKKLIR